MKSKMTRISAILITTFLLWAPLPLPTSQVDYAAAASIPDDIVRVYLSSYGTPSTFHMNATGKHTIQDNDKALSGAFTVKAVGGKIQLTDGGTVYYLDRDVTIKAGSYDTDNRIQVSGGYRFPGDFRLYARDGGIKIVNILDIETYLSGVLPYEVSNSWPIESLKAQAVAARSYTWYSMRSRDREKYEHDLVNTTSSQVYNGVNAANTNCLNAINATAKQVLKTNAGDAVYACFSASNGGHTEYPKASGAASVNFDYLPYKKDPYDLKYALATTTYSAKVVIPKTITAANIKSSGKQPYPMLRKKLKAAGVNVSGISGAITVTSIRLHSPRYTKPNRVFTGANITVKLDSGKSVTLNFPCYLNSRGTKRPFLNKELNVSDGRFSMLYLREDEDSFLLAATRYGHAAGMSQIGALQMAKEGLSYTDILSFYYAMGSKSQLVAIDEKVDGVKPPNSEVPTEATGVVSISGSDLNVRSGPGTDHDIIGVLKNGARVTIVATNGDWYKIQYKKGTAYVFANYIKLKKGTTPATPAKTAAAKKGKVSVSGGGSLNVRSGPGTDHKILGTLKHGATVTIKGSSGSWYKISYKGKTAYVKKSYIKVSATSGKSSKQTKAKKKGTVKLKSGSLNVRSGPGTDRKILGTLKKGATVTIKGSSGSWYKIAFKGKTGYVKKSYIKLK